MKLSIKSKLFLGFSLVLSVSLIVQLLGFLIIQRFIQSQTRTLILQEAQNAADEIEDFIFQIELDNLGIANEYTKNNEEIYPFVHYLIEYIFTQNRFYETITLLSPAGREIHVMTRHHTLHDHELSFEIPTEPFNQAVKGRTGISKVYFPEDSAIPYVDLFTPIIQQGEVIGVIKSQLHLEQMWDLIAQVELGNEGFAYIVDEEGRLLAHPESELVEQGENYASRPIVSALLADQISSLRDSDYFYIDHAATEVIANGVQISRLGWAILVEQPVSEAFSQLNLLRNLFYATLAGTTVLLTVISLLISGGLTNSIKKLKRMAEEIKKGNLHARANINTGDEIQELAESFNKMSSSLMISENVLKEENEFITAERNKLEITLAGITDAVIAVDQSRRVVLFNKAAELLTGYSPEEALNAPIDTLITLVEADQELAVEQFCPIQPQISEGVTLNKENVTLIGKNDRRTEISLIVSTIKEASSVNLGCILTLHDMTKEKQLEDMKLDFVSMAAHELRTPLTAITGYLSVYLSENEANLNEDQKMLVTRANLAGQQLMGLVENLLNVSQIERGTITLHVAPIDWKETVVHSVEDLQSRAKDKNITLNFIDNAKEIKPVYADKLRITEVLNNLVSNAINYTDPGGTVTVWLESNEEEVTTYVKDTGIGIPAEALSHLFTKFFRVSGPLEQGSKGTGLGLYISKSIVEMHHGRIWVESELNKGSTFMFSLPTKPYDQDSVN
jgi:PAS domain S-box-containing protein